MGAQLTNMKLYYFIRLLISLVTNVEEYMEPGE